MADNDAPPAVVSSGLPAAPPVSSGLPTVIRIVTESPAARQDAPSLEWIKLAVEFTKTLAWPVLVAVLVIAYHEPIGEGLRGLVLKLNEASKVSFGSLSFEIQQTAKQVGSPDLAVRVGALTPTAVDVLLSVPRGENTWAVLVSTFETEQRYGFPARPELDALEELEAKDFIRFRWYETVPGRGLNDHDHKLAEFLNWFRDLGLMRVGNTASDSEDRTWYSGINVTAAQKARLTTEQYQLTESGRKAVAAIRQAVINELGGSTSTSTDR